MILAEEPSHKASSTLHSTVRFLIATASHPARGTILDEQIHVSAVRNVCSDTVNPSLVISPAVELDTATSRPSV
jgi:hypothetical protein